MDGRLLGPADQGRSPFHSTKGLHPAESRGEQAPERRVPSLRTINGSFHPPESFSEVREQLDLTIPTALHEQQERDPATSEWNSSKEDKAGWKEHSSIISMILVSFPDSSPSNPTPK